MDDIDYITDEVTKIQKKAHKRNAPAGGKRIKIRSTGQVARANYRAAKKLHRDAIRQLRRDIKKHKLLKRQARIAYKLSR